MFCSDTISPACNGACCERKAIFDGMNSNLQTPLSLIANLVSTYDVCIPCNAVAHFACELIGICPLYVYQRHFECLLPAPPETRCVSPLRLTGKVWHTCKLRVGSSSFHLVSLRLAHLFTENLPDHHRRHHLSLALLLKNIHTQIHLAPIS